MNETTIVIDFTDRTFAAVMHDIATFYQVPVRYEKTFDTASKKILGSGRMRFFRKKLWQELLYLEHDSLYFFHYRDGIYISRHRRVRMSVDGQKDTKSLGELLSIVPSLPSVGPVNFRSE